MDLPDGVEQGRVGRAGGRGGVCPGVRPALYFASVDIKHCYDTVDQVGLSSRFCFFSTSATVYRCGTHLFFRGTIPLFGHNDIFGHNDGGTVPRFGQQ